VIFSSPLDIQNNLVCLVFSHLLFSSIRTFNFAFLFSFLDFSLLYIKQKSS
jgi:hypothetical protein